MEEKYDIAVISDEIQNEIEEFQRQLQNETHRELLLIAYEKLIDN